MSQRASHPNIAKLVRQIEHIDYLYASGDRYSAWKLMLVLINGISPKNKREKKAYPALKNSLEYAIKRVDNVPSHNYPDAVQKRFVLENQIDADFQVKFMDLLWDCNLLSDGGYGFFDPSLEKSSDDITLKKTRDTSKIR